MDVQLMMAVIVFWPLIAAFIATTQRSASASMRIDFYDQTCPNAEKIVFAQMKEILRRPEFNNAPAQLLRLFFHYCGPFYPLYTGRRDSRSSHFDKSANEILRPTETIDVTLKLFADRGFTVRETVALLGGHSIGFINCDFIVSRVNVSNHRDPHIDEHFKEEILERCEDTNNNFSMMEPGLSFSSSPLRSHFGTYYFESLTRGRGLQFSDMELMLNEETRSVVEEYVSDDETTFQRDFTRALVKMSNLVTVTGFSR
ncbi:OLC1v1037743C1 [Oldenlandia corymbosa var. corymbosa]|uniref:peroxidase n=1 Tax=Oldenlandia corymbosa var. corymbosa TaxID=529605 RepID=A0AAV1CYR2_OLDCO|nr:OLC1v1037743C1 [Oldenlandia corymbosa var. corymbosa]